MDDRTEVRGSYRPLVPGCERVGTPAAGERITVTVTVRGPALPGVDAHPAPAMSPERFAATYGASQADLDLVAGALADHGLTVLAVSPTTRSVLAEGSIAGVERTFGVELATYRTPGGEEEFRGRSGSITVPAVLDGIVTGVFGLDQRRVAERTGTATASDGALAPPLTPADLEARYRFPDRDASGRRVAIAEFGGGYFPEDVSAYCLQHGRPDPVQDVTLVPVGFQPLTLEQLKQLPQPELITQAVRAAECMMDIEIVTSLCPGAQVAVYYAPFTESGWINLLDRVVADPPPVALSISWGIREDSAHGLSAAGMAAIDERLAALATLGVTVCVASGDDGSGDNANDDGLHVSYPASSPFVLAVGGTMIDGDREVAWREGPGTRFAPDGSQTGGGASGGGISVVQPRPPWQDVLVDPPVPRPFDGRIVPDVAAAAAVRAYEIVFAGRRVRDGGTSAATPVWAALLTRVAAAVGGVPQFLTPLLYRPPGGAPPLGRTAFTDITGGTNTSEPRPGIGYAARPGHDAVTGWGVPDGIALAAALTAVRA